MTLLSRFQGLSGTQDGRLSRLRSSLRLWSRPPAMKRLPIASARPGIPTPREPLLPDGQGSRRCWGSRSSVGFDWLGVRRGARQEPPIGEEPPPLGNGADFSRTASPGKTETAPDKRIFHDTDFANARRLAKLHGADLRFTPERGWIVWSGARWVPDDQGLVMELPRIPPNPYSTRSATPTRPLRGTLQMGTPFSVNRTRPRDAGAHTVRTRHPCTLDCLRCRFLGVKSCKRIA
jgi:hypothetical protein